MPRQSSIQTELTREETSPLGVTLKSVGLAGQSTQPGNLRRDSQRWIRLVRIPVILFLIFGGLIVANMFLTHVVSNTRSYQVNTDTNMVLLAQTANVMLIPGLPNQVTVVSREQVLVWDNDQLPLLAVKHQASGPDSPDSDNSPNLAVSLGEENGFTDKSDLFLTVEVPTQMGVYVQTTTGNITSSGIEGSMTLVTDSGNLLVDGGKGHIFLTTVSGAITSRNGAGQMAFSAGGNISVSRATLVGDCSYQSSGGGNITFSGSLDRKSAAGFRASAGTITLLVASQASFHAQVFTGTGGSATSQFSWDQWDKVDFADGSSGTRAVVTVGQAPFAQIIAQTDSGDITLEKAG